jgi:hypothetical protein
VCRKSLLPRGTGHGMMEAIWWTGNSEKMYSPVVMYSLTSDGGLTRDNYSVTRKIGVVVVYFMVLSYYSRSGTRISKFAINSVGLQTTNLPYTR